MQGRGSGEDVDCVFYLAMMVVQRVWCSGQICARDGNWDEMWRSFCYHIGTESSSGSTGESPMDTFIRISPCLSATTRTHSSLLSPTSYTVQLFMHTMPHSRLLLCPYIFHDLYCEQLNTLLVLVYMSQRTSCKPLSKVNVSVALVQPSYQKSGWTRSQSLSECWLS